MVWEQGKVRTAVLPRKGGRKEHSGYFSTQVIHTLSKL